MASQKERGMKAKAVWFTADEWAGILKAVEKMNSAEFRDVRKTWIPQNREMLTPTRFVQVAAVTAAESIVEE